MYSKDRADSSGSCWPGINTIAVELGLSRSTVKRALAEPCREELIAKLPRQRSNGGCTRISIGSCDVKTDAPARGASAYF
ncbi:MAG: helix-turn-helix domain-containing protein [Oscillospiraceae bacterium]